MCVFLKGTGLGASWHCCSPWPWVTTQSSRDQQPSRHAAPGLALSGNWEGKQPPLGLGSPLGCGRWLRLDRQARAQPRSTSGFGYWRWRFLCVILLCFANNSSSLEESLYTPVLATPPCDPGTFRSVCTRPHQWPLRTTLSGRNAKTSGVTLHPDIAPSWTP